MQFLSLSEQLTVLVSDLSLKAKQFKVLPTVQ